MIYTRDLEQSIMTTYVNGGLDVTNKAILQKCCIELKPQDFTDMSDKDLYKIILSRVQKDELYYSYELLSDTTLPDVKQKIEYYMELGKNGVQYTTLESNIYKLKKRNRYKLMSNYLSNIASAFKQTLEVNKLDEIVSKNLDAINELDSLQVEHASDIHGLLTEHAYDKKPVKHYQTTLKKLNDALKGLGMREGTLCVIAGASGVGKSSFSLFLLDSIASLCEDRQSLFFSLELDKTELMERYLGVLSKKPYSEMSQHEIEQTTVKALMLPNIKVYDSIDYPDIKYISSIIRHSILASYSKPISVIVVDFIGLVKIEDYRESKAQMLEDIAYQLLSLSKKLGCVIILLQQVNRDYYKREGSDIVPIASDASDSSGPEKASSLWIGIGRHGEYDGKDPNHFEVAIRKNRHGIKDFRFSLEFANGTFKQLSPGFQFRDIQKHHDDGILTKL